MEEQENVIQSVKCGIIMPISEIDGCTEQHWREVKGILTDAIKSANFEAELVCEAEDIGIIQKRIIQNIYQNPVIVCDVSGKNPNVMFELGLRLAFDKPTIIVKDDKTNYSFDTSPIEHLTYPRDLRYTQIVEFKEKLAVKIKGTHNKACNDPTYTTFLKNFGEFTLPKLDTKEVTKEEYILEELRELKNAFAYYVRRQSDIIRNERLSYRQNEKEILNTIQSIIEMEVVNYLNSNNSLNLLDIRKGILENAAIRDYSRDTNISKNLIIKLIDETVKRYLNQITINDIDKPL